MRHCVALVVALLLVSLAGVRAGGADDQYFDVYKLIREADALIDSGGASPALAKYNEALTALRNFQKVYPDWNAPAVNYRLGYLTEKVAGLSAKLAPPPQPTHPTAPPPTAPAPPPSDWENQLNTLKEQARLLLADKALLEAKLKEALATQPAASDPRELAKAEEKIKALQKENDLLSVSLEQVKAQAAAAALAAASAPAKSTEADHIKQLESQRDDLTRKLEAANKSPAARKDKAPSRAPELQNEINRLRARLEVLEAQKIPYTTEELALLKAPEPRLAPTNTLRHSVRELPVGLAALVTEAQRYLTAKQFDKAEALYLQVLREDEKNVGALADLALIDLQLNRLDAADKHIQRALELAPDNPDCLLILGRLRWFQKNNDAALDALGRAAQTDPRNPEIHNFLGVILSEKGQRTAAEAAFRKAVLLAPNYGDAHKNLAYFYLIQQPPSVELARWHYQKALAAGLPHNADIDKLLDSKKAAPIAQ